MKRKKFDIMKRNKKEVMSLRITRDLKNRVDALRKEHPVAFHNRNHLFEVALWELLESYKPNKEKQNA